MSLLQFVHFCVRFEHSKSLEKMSVLSALLRTDVINFLAVHILGQ